MLLTLCQNKKCPIRKQCLRGQDSNDKYQTYFFGIYENNKCGHFIPIDEGTEIENNIKNIERNFK